MATHYEILGVDPFAGHQDVRRAYLRQARRHHPDARPDADHADAERARRRMIRINAAWAVLGDSDLRRAYDTEIGLGRGPDVSADDFGTWRPTEPDDDIDLLGEETEDVGPRGPADLLVLVPVALLALSVAVFAFSVLAQSSMLMWAAIVLLPVVALAFVATPLLVLFTRTRARAKP